MKTVALITALALTSPAFAICPAAPDHSAAMQVLIDDVRAAENELEGRRIGAKMWDLWADAPDAQSQEVLDKGMNSRRAFNFVSALKEFDTLVKYCPNYAEGYNQRAFVNFLTRNYDAAVVDLEKAIELSPHHIAARAGLALTYMELGDTQKARTELKRALEDNPWLSERHLLDKGGRLAPKGEDI